MPSLQEIPGWSAVALALANTGWLYVKSRSEAKGREADAADDPEDGRVGGRLARKLRAQESRLGAMDTRMNDQDIRLDGLEQDLSQILSRMEKAFGAMERRFDELLGWIRDLRERRGLSTTPRPDDSGTS